MDGLKEIIHYFCKTDFVGMWKLGKMHHLTLKSDSTYYFNTQPEGGIWTAVKGLPCSAYHLLLDSPRKYSAQGIK